MSGGNDQGGVKCTAMQILIEVDKSLFQFFDVAEWNALVADLAERGLMPAVWAPGERPPPVAVVLDFHRLQRKHYHLDGINLGMAWLEEANFEGASLKNAKLGCCPNATFKDARLQGANFEDCDISGCCFEGAQLDGADFSGAAYHPDNPPVGLPAEILAVCKADPDATVSSAKPQERPGERPLGSCVTVAAVPW